MELWRRDATDLAALVRAGDVSALEVARDSLARLEAVNPAINAITRALADEAMAQAAAVDAARTRGETLGLLAGVPTTTKITHDHRGSPTDNGVVSRKDLIAEEDSPAVASLRAAGAVFVGRTASPAIAMRGMTSSALHGLTLNPWNPAVTCGGSSGGAGAATAAGIGALALGSDIGGSIRWPAYCNGVVGLRPSVGRVPQFNATAPNPRGFAGQIMAVSGPMARSVRDLRLGLAVMSARDPRDAMWVPAPLEGPPAPKRAAIVAAPEGIAVHPAVSAAIRTAAAHLAAAGYEIEEVEPPGLNEASELWHPIGLTQLSMTLAPILEEIGDPALSNFIRSWIAGKGVADLGGYMAALARRDWLIAAWTRFFERFPVVLMPNCAEPSLEAELDTKGAEGAMRAVEGLRFQLVCPVLGLPGLSVPVGEHAGQPLGVQIVAARYRDDLCLAAGEIIEAAEGVRTPIDPRGAA